MNLKRFIGPILIVVVVAAVTFAVFWSLRNDTTFEQMDDSQANIMTKEGNIVCLPHIDTSGPQTLECAFGLLDDSGNYYGLVDGNPVQNRLGNVPSGTRVSIEGTFTPGNDAQYQEIGTLTITSITEL